jgi:membrane protease YdiL (CAAX protease family)
VQILRRDEARAQAIRQLESAAPLLPHSANENRMFKLVSVTAGACEEILFRGFLFWYFAISVGTAVAVILSSLVFGLGHIYMSSRQVPKTAGAGMVMACLAIASGSLWPAILIHAATDWNSGEIGYRLIGGGPTEGTSVRLLSQS